MPERMAATSPPPLLWRVLPGVWMVASWCAVIAYAISALVLGPSRFRVLTPRGLLLVPQHMTGLRMALDGLAAMPWPLLATAGVAVLSAVLLRRWPLSALALLLAGAIAAAIMPEPQIANLYMQLAVQPPAFFLVPPAGVAVGYIAATRPRLVSVGAAVIALGVLARYAAMGSAAGLTIRHLSGAGRRRGNRHRLADRPVDPAEPRCTPRRVRAQAQAAGGHGRAAADRP